MDRSDVDLLKPFYSLSHWARLLLMALLAATFVGTTGQAVWQLAQPTDRLTGLMVEVAETRLNNGYAIYNLLVRTDQGELSTVRLENNGRILRYLLAKGEFSPGRATVHLRQGKVTALDLLDGKGPTIRDSRVPPLVRLLIGLLPLLILIFHVRPRLMGRHNDHTDFS